jgi:hypothetical protein
VSQSSPITPLASAEVNHDHLAIELVEPIGMPPMVKIVWPPAATVIDPKQFGPVATALTTAFAGATVRLAQIRRDRKL